MPTRQVRIGVSSEIENYLKYPTYIEVIFLWTWHNDSCIIEWHFSFHPELPWPNEAWIHSLSLSSTVPWSASKTIPGVVGHFNAWQLPDGGVSLLLPSYGPPSLQMQVSGSYQYIKPPKHPTTQLPQHVWVTQQQQQQALLSLQTWVGGVFYYCLTIQNGPPSLQTQVGGLFHWHAP